MANGVRVDRGRLFNDSRKVSSTYGESYTYISLIRVSHLPLLPVLFAAFLSFLLISLALMPTEAARVYTYVCVCVRTLVVAGGCGLQLVGGWVVGWVASIKRHGWDRQLRGAGFRVKP